jgi:hypothetical protein
MAEDQNPGRLNLFERITRIATSISVIVGIGAAIFGMFNSLQSWRYSQLAGVNQYIDEDTQVRAKVLAFSQQYNGPEGKKKIHDLIEQKGSCEAAYYSPELADMREVGRHYERMGTLLRLNYLNFDLLYEVVVFPGDFWSETEEFRNQARAKWDKSGTPLPDFWKNFEYLKGRYDQRRKQDRGKN